MKKTLNFVIILTLIVFINSTLIVAQTTKTVGTGGDYTTLNAAFDAINTGIITGNISLQIISSTTETASASLNSSGFGNASYSSINIYPVFSGLSINANFNNPVIYLNGADNIIIDGRVNGVGTTKDLTIQNINTGGSSVVIRYLNSSENNVLKYCTLKASCYSTGTGMIYFTSSSSGNGNDNNIIEYCDITNAGGNRPVNVIFSSGGAGRENSGNIIRNNNIYDFFTPNADSRGINISYLSTDWTISGNSFYETTTFVPNGDYKYYPIFLNTGTNTITDNYIGGNAPLCAGSVMTINANTAHFFCGIFINSGTGVASSVQNNTICNIYYVSVEDNPWDGIYINSGNVDVTGNTIGAITGNGSITVNTPVAVATATISGGVVTGINLIGGGSGYTIAPVITFSASGSTTPATAIATISGGVVTDITITNGGAGYTAAPNVVFDGQSNIYSTTHGMIQNSPNTVNITNNNIGSITTVSSNYYSHGFESIYVRGVACNCNISNNLIGSLTSANSIHVSSAAALSLQKQDVYGIYCSGTGTTIISENTIANLTNSYSGTNSGSKARGIQATAGTNTIVNNIVCNISTSSNQASSLSSASVTGISQTTVLNGTIQVISGNLVYNISNTSVASKAQVYGIYYNGPPSGDNRISGNFVHSMSVSSTDIGAYINGVVINSGVVTCSNNIINLNNNGIGSYINGIWDGTNNSTDYINCYFNSIYIGGNVTSGTTSSTSCIWNANNVSHRNYRNNIFNNSRSGGSSGYHYAIRLAGITNVTIDYNNYFVSGSNSILGRIGTLDKANLTAWKTGTGQDVNSLNLDPGYTIPGGTSAHDYYTSAILTGITGTGITTDYDGLIRGAVPKMGALESNSFIWKGSTSTDFATASNWLGGVVPLSGANIVFDASPVNNCILDQNRIIGDITNAQSTHKFITNGYQLTINGNIVFTNGAQIDASAINSIINFNGTANQSIPSGSFFNNIIDNLIINNAGLSLNGDLTINSSIALITGNFAIGPNTLTFYGVVTAMTGTVTGGSSTNMIIGGTGATISMPDFLLNNLTIDRVNGVSLYGNLNIVGILTLTSGTLTLGANTLTLSGSSPVRTSGFIDASDANANLIFSNSSAITLPASLFLGNVNDFTVNGVGGVTSSSDFTISGVLLLQADNPSATKGLLDMGVNNLTMGANATTIGAGDVTGIIRRTTILPMVTYTFGNQFMTAYFPDEGTIPSEMSAKIRIGSAPTWRTGAINREIEIIQTGGSATKAVFSCHYLDSELNGNNEEHLVLWVGLPTNVEYGRSNFNSSENWVALSNINVAFFSSSWDATKNISLDDYGTASTLVWNGSLSDSWTSVENWTPNVGPSSVKNIIIPDAQTTPNDPVLPSFTEIYSLTIEAGGILNSVNSAQLTINGGSGAWSSIGGEFNPNTSNVIFSNDNSTISGTTNFYNVTINTGKVLWLTDGSTMRIAGTMTNNGIWRTVIGYPTTVEYNGGDQTVVVPDTSTNRYSTLILSGSGTKTMPLTAMSVYGNLIVSGTTIVSVGADLTINGNVTIENGSTFISGNFNHSIAGNFIIDGTYTASSGNTITMNSSSGVQHIEGAASLVIFYNLTVNNTYSSGNVVVGIPVQINNTLTLTSNNMVTYTDYPFEMAAGSGVIPEGGSALSFVDGPISKTGTSSFVFPIGNGYRWARIGIGSSTELTTFLAQYYSAPDTIVDDMSTAVFPVLSHVSSKEYWNLERTSGAGKATVTLFWEDAQWSGIDDCSGNSLRIAHMNPTDSTWENNNDLVTITGSCIGASSGSISTNSVVTSFSPFTFGSLSATSNPLPVELISFNAVLENNNVILDWATASELNNAWFILEKSDNAYDFFQIANIQGMGNSNKRNDYSFTDINPMNGIIYYRLTQVDFNGELTISKIISVEISNLNSDNSKFEVFPNPINAFESPILRLSGFEQEKSVLVVIYNILGEELYSKFLITDCFGNSIVALDIENKLPAGTYLIVGTSLNRRYNKCLVVK